MIALVGDAELDEGNVYECLQEGWKHGLRNSWWIIDYNRQSLDGVVREGLYERIEAIFRAFDWEVVTLKYGALQRAAFAEPGGERLQGLDRRLPERALFGADVPGGAAWRERLIDEIGDQGRGLGAARPAAPTRELAELMDNLGGHCIRDACSRHSTGRAATARPCSSPIRSRAGARRSPGTRTTMPG